MDWRLPHITSRPRTRKVAAVLAYLGAVGVQAGLANISVTVDVAKFSPLIVSAGDELVIQGPVVNARDGLFFSKTGDTNQILDAYFPRARFGDGTGAAAGGLRKISYVTQAATASSPSLQHCRSSIEIRLVNATSPAEIGLFQLEAQSDSPYLEVEVKNAALAVNLATDSDTGDHSLTACGYQKVLRVSGVPDDGRQADAPSENKITQSGPPITVVVDTDSAFRFYFRPLQKSAPSQGSGAEMLPLDLGTPKMKFEDPQPVRSHAVWKNSLQHNQAKGGIAEFSARALGTEALLDFSKLEIGSDQMRLSLSGKARVEVQGKEQTANLWDEVKEVPLLERSIEAANTALLGWVGIVLFRKPKVKDS